MADLSKDFAAALAAASGPSARTFARDLVVALHLIDDDYATAFAGWVAEKYAEIHAEESVNG